MLLLAFASHAENLLKNPSFEITAGSVPAEWSLFVQPKDDASATLEQRVAKDGNHAVKLTIESPYLEDPANNWSQNILEDVRGKRIVLRGFIKTEGVGEAAIWVQCYQRNPLRMILQESTSSNGLLTGTQDWTPVHATVDVPMATDFVVVRCVLRFRGTAWFDALSLEVDNNGAHGEQKPEAAALKMPALPSMPELPKVETPDKPTSAEAAELLEAHEELRKVNAALRSSNAVLSKQIEELRKQIEELKRQVDDTAKAARELKEQQIAPIEREQPVHVPPPPLISAEPPKPEAEP